MRILQITPAYYPAVRYGGPIKSVHGLASALGARGHDVHVYTSNMDGDRNLDVPLDRPVMIDHVAVHYFPVSWLRRLCLCPALNRRLQLTTETFDVVHLHSVYLWPTYAGARAASRTRVPYLVSPRGMLVGELIRRKNRWFKEAWINLVEKKSLADAGGVHVTSPLEGEDIKALGFKIPEMFCVPNGVSWPDHPQPLAHGPFANLPRPYALFLSRISWKKGLDRLIAAWKWVNDLHLVIAGNDDENLLPRLRAQVIAENVGDRVHFVGPASDEHKWALYSNAEMFVLPSYSENFGNVIAEAMAMSCPVVVTPEVGLAALVRDSGAGIVTNGEPRELARTISQFLADTTGRKRAGEFGRQAAAERLSWGAVAEQIEAAYHRIRRCHAYAA